MDSSSEEYRYANLAVKHGYMGIPSGGCFGPDEAMSTAGALEGLVRGMGLGAPASQAQGIYPKAPAYTGFTVVAHDLHLKNRDTRAWPDDPYRRAEMAFSLEAADNVDEWRLEYVEDTFDWLRCQTPLIGSQREKAIASAFAKIGCPYVWGGESDAEHGFDCSGLVYYVLGSRLGYPMMRVADDQARDGRYAVVPREGLLAGDPIFFHSSSSSTPGYVGHAGMYIGRDLFIHSTGSNAGVSVDRLTGYWEEQFACGKRVIGENEPESFDTFILLANPYGKAAEAKLTYMLLDGRRFTRREKLDPYSRKTVKVDDTLVNQEMSVSVEATSGQVIAERSMYFHYLKRYPGGHDSPGAHEPALNWYLAEGCTAWGFDTYVLIANPGSEATDVTVTFMADSGGTVDVQCVVAPFSRYTVEVDSIPGMEVAEFSTRITADSPVVVERWAQLAGGYRTLQRVVLRGGVHDRGLRHLPAACQPGGPGRRRDGDPPGR
jgi:cell wall-associated NlpC family hydrolase